MIKISLIIIMFGISIIIANLVISEQNKLKTNTSLLYDFCVSLSHNYKSKMLSISEVYRKFKSSNNILNSDIRSFIGDCKLSSRQSKIINNMLSQIENSSSLKTETALNELVETTENIKKIKETEFEKNKKIITIIIPAFVLLLSIIMY